MVQLIDFNKIDIIKLHETEVKTITITINKQGLLDLPTSQMYNELSTAVQEKIAAAAILPKDNLWFDVNIQDPTIEETDEDCLFLLCANIIAANLIIDKNREREREMRLKGPASINTNGLFGILWLRNMINKQMLCDRVGGIIQINDSVSLII